MAEGGRSALGASLLLVACLHLATTQGTWIVTDQAEYLAVASRMLRGHLTLADAGEPSYPGVPWAPRSADDIQRSRLLPLTSVSLAPLLALDQALGLTDPVRIGRVVHLQGHLFVLPALGLLGLAVAAGRARPGAVAASVLLAGTCWPIWVVSRRGGPEAIQLAIVAAVLLAVRLDGRRAALAIALVAGALLPWTNPTGPVVGAALAAGLAVEEPARARWPSPTLAFAGALALSTLSVLGLWNLLYQGEAWSGGYSIQPGSRDAFLRAYFLKVSPLAGTGQHLSSLLVDGLPVLGCAVAGAFVTRQPRRLAPAIIPTLVIVALFATFGQPEPTRRLAFTWPLWACAAGEAWDGLPLRARDRALLVFVAALWGLALFLDRDGAYLLGPDGIFYPCVLWLELAFAGRPAWQWALPLAGLAGGAGLALRQLRQLTASYA